MSRFICYQIFFFASTVPQVPPLNVRAGELTPSTIELLFDDIVDTFQIFGHPTGSKINITAVSDIFVQQEYQYGGVNSVVITGLYAYTNYSLSVAIGTRRGFEVYSAPILVRTNFGRMYLFHQNNISLGFL